MPRVARWNRGEPVHYELHKNNSILVRVCSIQYFNVIIIILLCLNLAPLPAIPEVPLLPREKSLDTTFLAPGAPNWKLQKHVPCMHPSCKGFWESKCLQVSTARGGLSLLGLGSPSDHGRQLGLGFCSPIICRGWAGWRTRFSPNLLCGPWDVAFEIWASFSSTYFLHQRVSRICLDTVSTKRK